MTPSVDAALPATRRGGAERRQRRSHAERTAQTRGRIIAAVVESIAEAGYQRTTAAEVTRRAGVTWGAVQHHFGGKEGLLLAVLEDSFDRFAARLTGVATPGSGLEERASRFVDRAWKHFGSSHFRSTFEILLNQAEREAKTGEDRAASWQSQLADAWDQVWQQLFSETGMSRRRRRQVQHFVISSLAGMASLQILEHSGRGAASQAELEMLKRAMVRELREVAP